MDTAPPDLPFAPGPPEPEGMVASGNGRHAPLPPARKRPPSLKPALVVVAIAVALVLAFGIGSALSTGTPAPAPSVHLPNHPTEAGTRALASVEDRGTPPADVLGALVVPAGSRVRASNPWTGATQFSATVSFSTSATQASVVSFFTSELSARGWSMLGTGPAHNHPTSTQVLAKRASNDGWYWEVGVTVSPTTFGAGGTKMITRFSVALFEIPDAT